MASYSVLLVKLGKEQSHQSCLFYWCTLLVPGALGDLGRRQDAATVFR
jgi:hypothetical protein